MLFHVKRNALKDDDDDNARNKLFGDEVPRM